MRSRVLAVVAIVTMVSTVLAPTAVNAQVTPTCNGLAATLVGTEGDDVLIGTDGPDVIVGLGGNDILRGLGGNDTMCGDNGRDRLFGGRGHDTLLGGKKNDIVKGDAGKDKLFGNQGNDRLFGGGGADRLEGGSGLGDKMFGKGGVDECLDPQDVRSIYGTCEGFTGVVLDRTSFGGEVQATSWQLANDPELDDPLVAFLFAIERGYTYSQIRTAAAAGTLDDRGHIRGGAVSPELERAGVLELPVPSLLARSLEFQSHESVVTRLQEFLASGKFETHGDAGRMLIALILILYRSGYGLNQITPAFLLGTGYPNAVDGGPCFALFDDQKRLIAPADDVDPVCTAALTSEGNRVGFAPDDTPPPVVDPPPVPDPPPLEWVGEFTGFSPLAPQHGLSEFRMTREAGTDNFTLHAFISTIQTTAATNCTLIIENTFDGTGTFNDLFGGSIRFDGTWSQDKFYPDCTNPDTSRPLDVAFYVELGESRIHGTFIGFTFEVPGNVPQPV